MLDETTEFSGLVGRRFSLSCIADGVPLPDITWLKDDCPLTRHIKLSSRIQTTEHVIQGFRVHVPEAKESILTVEDSIEHDSGLYSCRATNTLGTASLPGAHQVAVNGTHTLYHSFLIHALFEREFLYNIYTLCLPTKSLYLMLWRSLPPLQQCTLLGWVELSCAGYRLLSQPTQEEKWLKRETSGYLCQLGS